MDELAYMDQESRRAFLGAAGTAWSLHVQGYDQEDIVRIVITEHPGANRDMVLDAMNWYGEQRWRPSIKAARQVAVERLERLLLSLNIGIMSGDLRVVREAKALVTAILDLQESDPENRTQTAPESDAELIPDEIRSLIEALKNRPECELT